METLLWMAAGSVITLAVLYVIYHGWGAVLGLYHRLTGR